MNCKKIVKIIVIIFAILNFALLVYNLFFYKKNDIAVSNDDISINIINGFYLNKKNDKLNSISLYGNDKVSSVNILLSDQSITNRYMYTSKEILESIFYQMLDSPKKYKELLCSENDNSIRCNYVKNTYHYDMYVRFYNTKALIILYTSDGKKYNKSIIDNMLRNIKVKNEEV